MAFIKIVPIGPKNPLTLKTTNEIDIQIWRELTSIRYTNKPQKLTGKKAITPWIDQAKTYYCDATEGNWRSAGLLYYYSFLNLAKALLVGKKIFSYRLLNKTSIYHGLAAELQEVNHIIDYEIDIYPPQKRDRNNVFSNLYEVITNKNWPFSNNVKIKLNEIFPYSSNISSELYEIFNIPKELISIQSLIRVVNDNVWLELLAPQSKISLIQSSISNFLTDIITRQNMTKFDRDEWFKAYEITSNSLNGYAFIRTNKLTFNSSNQNTILKQLISDSHQYISDFGIPSENDSFDFPHWIFVPKITLINTNLHWHPLLSNYLISFALSSILRYQPQLLKKETKDEFIAEAWCQQSPISVLKYFLMYFSFPPKRIEKI